MCRGVKDHITKYSSQRVNLRYRGLKLEEVSSHNEVQRSAGKSTRPLVKVGYYTVGGGELHKKRGN